jgi:hypothetical protein
VGVSVPRGCLSLPRWVRAGGGSGSMQDHTLYADDAQLDAGVGDDLVLGRRVRR